MQKLKIGGRELALAFTISAMDEMEKVTGAPVDLDNIKETVVESCKDRRKLMALVAILAHEGAILEGESSDIDAAWLAQHMRPGHLPKVQIAVLGAVADGMRMESAEGDEDEEVDVVLEELKKKAEPTE